MRILTTSLAAIAVLAMAIPATAQTTPTAPCEGETEAAALTSAGASETFNPAASVAFGHDILAEVDPSSTYGEDSVTRFTYRLDTSGDTAKPTSTRAYVDIDMDWDDDVSDFDLYVYDAAGSPLADGASNTLMNEVVDGGSGEHIAQLPVSHCAEIVLEVVNYSGLPIASIDLDLTVRLR